MSTIKIEGLRFSYDKQKEIFKNIQFTLKKDKTLSIIGTPNSGKTTLLKILNGECPYEGKVIINGIDVNKDHSLKLSKNILVVFKEEKSKKEIVEDELKYYMEEMDIELEEIKKRLQEVNEYFSINKILAKPIKSLNLNDRTLVKILSYALVMPSYIGLDDLLIDLNTRTKILLLNYLNSKNILLIHVTSDMEDVLYTDYIMCLYDGIIAIDGKTIDVLSNEKLLKRLGFSLPFLFDLSIQLKLYGLISKNYLNKEEMVKDLWK